MTDLTWQDVFCFLGLHAGKWGTAEKLDVYSGGTKPIRIEYYQSYTCPNCGRTKVKSCGNM